MRILFLCHGNICRSPMAEFVMKDLVRRAGRTDIEVESAALHTDEIGSDIHPGTRAQLVRHGIPFAPRAAWLLTARRAHDYDLLIGMDDYNLRDLKRCVAAEDQPKIHLLLDYAGERRAIADPWYTGDFDATYSDVVKGCAALLQSVCSSGGEG